MCVSAEKEKKWFVMRDLTRPNAKLPAYKLLTDEKFEVFTPMKWTMTSRRGHKERIYTPVIHDLLFVHSTLEALSPVVSRVPTLQFRFLRNTNRAPMTVPADDMQRFILAAGSTESPRYYMPAEITPDMHGKRIRIIGGLLEGMEGNLITTRGSKVKRLMVEIPQFMAVSVEVSPEYICLID